jgi:hypothetical protein
MANTRYCSFDDTENKQLEEIEYSKGLYIDQVAIVKKEERVCELLHWDYIHKIREYKTTYDYCTDIFAKAQKQIGEKLKKDRPDLETVKQFVISDFFNNDKTFKLTKIISCGWENYGYQVHFTGYGKNAYIEIPVKSRLTPKNLEYMYNGMFAFAVEESEHYISVLKTSYVIEAVAEFIKEYFELDKKEGD